MFIQNAAHLLRGHQIFIDRVCNNSVVSALNALKPATEDEQIDEKLSPIVHIKLTNRGRIDHFHRLLNDASVVRNARWLKLKICKSEQVQIWLQHRYIDWLYGNRDQSRTPRTLHIAVYPISLGCYGKPMKDVRESISSMINLLLKVISSFRT